MSADLRRVMVVRPTTTGNFAGAGWRTPDGDVLLRQHAAFVAVLERLGMRREALLVDNEWVKGEWTSELAYALLAEEWATSPASRSSA